LSEGLGRDSPCGVNRNEVEIGRRCDQTCDGFRGRRSEFFSHRLPRIFAD